MKRVYIRFIEMVYRGRSCTKESKRRKDRKQWVMKQNGLKTGNGE